MNKRLFDFIWLDLQFNEQDHDLRGVAKALWQYLLETVISLFKIFILWNPLNLIYGLKIIRKPLAFLEFLFSIYLFFSLS